MISEIRNQFSLTRAASINRRRAKNQFPISSLTVTFACPSLRLMKVLVTIMTGMLALSNIVFADDVVQPSSPLLMESTFKVEGGGKLGTCFILSKPGGTNWGWNILVTANHVLAGIASDEATLNLRETNEFGIFTNFPWTIHIRDKGKPLWTCHPEADVAALVLPLPDTFGLNHHWISSDWLAGDERFKSFDIRPGDELMCLGYPLGLESGAGGFPILRSGRIASYPAWPSSKAKIFLLDMTTYGGNSGGPVFYDFRKRQLAGLPSSQWVDGVGIAGLVSQDIRKSEHTEGYFGSSTLNMPLGIAVVVPAEFIRQTLDMVISGSSGNSPTNSNSSGTTK
jgi:Trypsin-like peptidase domain